VLFSDGPDKAFLVPDSCRVTEGSGNSINADLTDNTIYNYKIDDDFSYFQTICQLVWTFSYCRINTILYARVL
jgi:hypothetical protein